MPMSIRICIYNKPVISLRIHQVVRASAMSKSLRARNDTHAAATAAAVVAMALMPDDPMRTHSLRTDPLVRHTFNDVPGALANLHSLSLPLAHLDPEPSDRPTVQHTIDDI